tara:strand:+ start:209 stop:490 length:282 start_codon:yes stop_codon:yes gene_type:complete
MSKKNKVVELTTKAERITEDQLRTLQSVVNDNNALQFKVGAIEAQKYSLITRQQEVQSIIVDLQEEFSKQYGTFDVDLNDGTINYGQDGESHN